VQVQVRVHQIQHLHFLYLHLYTQRTIIHTFIPTFHFLSWHFFFP
jgi:hypothetical protein